MRIAVAAIGRLKDGPERDLAERYVKRADQAGRRIGFRAVDVVEIRESRAADVPRRMADEAVALTAAVPPQAVTIALDERGRSLDSPAFAAQLGEWRDAGRPAAVFLIGGDDGLAPALREQAALTLSFGSATWPHPLVRVMLLEQVYRAITILSGHPYHRA